MSSEKLGCSRYIFFFYCFSAFYINNGRMFFGNIILIKPTDDLNLSLFFNIKIILFNIVNKVIKNAIAIRKRNGEEQFRIIIGFFKQFG